MLDPLIIGCAANNRFAIPLAAMIRSVLVNRSPERAVTFYIFESDLRAAARERIEAVATGDGVSLVWVHAEHAGLQDLPSSFSFSTYDRLFVSDRLPASLSKVIWLDADLLVLRDLGELWTLEMGDNAILAVQDMVVPYVSSTLGLGEWQRLGLRPDAPYFNSGVLVIDLNVWRREEIGAQAVHYLRSRKRRVAMPDQEALNVVVKGRWGALDPRWNRFASLLGRGARAKLQGLREGNTGAVEDPWILHFAGDWKPWTLPHGRPPYDLFFHYLDQTGWTGWRPPASLSGSLRAVYYDNLRETLHPIESLYTALRFRRLAQHLRQARLLRAQRRSVHR